MDPYLAEIRLFPTRSVPNGWVPCEGQILAINQNQALFSLIGTIYGGDGQTTFRLPDLRGRVVVHTGSGSAGEVGGERTHRLTTTELPPHRHAARATATAATTADPAGARWATTEEPHYGPSAQVAMAGTAGVAGANEAHDNMPPYLALTYAIAVSGMYPSEDAASSYEAVTGEIRLFAGLRTPGGWAECNGQTIPLQQNTALFSLLGVQYGGDGGSTFRLPDLRDRTPVHTRRNAAGRFAYPGEAGGQATVTLTEQQLPAHGHAVATATAGTRGTTGNPSGASWAVAQQGRTRRALYGTGPADVLMPDATAVTGSGLPHNNLPPYLRIRALIALTGVYPPRP